MNVHKRASALDRAHQLGKVHGRNAASWVFEPRESRQKYLKMLEGLENNDPEVLDSLPSCPLSGEMADSMTPQKLIHELDLTDVFEEGACPVHEAGDCPSDRYDCFEKMGFKEELETRYEEGYDQGVSDEIISECVCQLTEQVIFTIAVNMVPDDPRDSAVDVDALLVKFEDVVGASNLDLDESSHDWEG